MKITEEEAQATNPYGTHRGPLTAIVLATSGPVLELGCGFCSTELLHGLCAQRELLSLENNADWLCHFIDFRTSLHSVRLVETWDEAPIDGRPWDVVLVDHAPAERRVVEIARLRKNAKFLVVHDTEDAGYGYEPLLATFRHRKDFKTLRPWTTIVSDHERIPV